MKKGFFVIIGLAFISTTKAQSTASNDLEIIQSVFGKSKKQLIESYMGLDDNAAAGFWPVYEAYEAKRRELVKTRLNNLARYVNNYETLTDGDAASIAKQAFKDEKSIAALHKKYFKKMKKAAGGLYAAKFMQMETYLQRTAETEVMDDIPFIGEIENLKQ